MELLISAIPGLVTGLFGSFVGYHFARRTARDTEMRAIRREAAADLSAPLRDLRSASRRWGRVELSQDEVAAGVLAWSEAFDRQAHRLPEQWRHVGRSVRAAVGEVFGGVALTDIRPEMAAFPLAKPDFMWQDFADDYFTFVLNATVRWGDGQEHPSKLVDFDTWLDKSGRRQRSN